MIPTTVRARPSSVIARPTRDGSAPKRRAHSRWLMSTAGSAPGASSSGRNVRPSAAFTPSSGKSEAVASSARSSSGSPVPVRFTVTGTPVTAARSVNVSC